MIPQSISFVFCIMAAVFSSGLIVVSAWIKALQPNGKCHIFIMIVSWALAVLSGVLLHQSGFYLTVEIGFK